MNSGRTPVLPMFAYVEVVSTSQKRKGHGKGIGVYQIDRSSGAWSLVEVFDLTLDNPGFLALDSQHNYLYSAHGDGTGNQRLFDRSRDGQVGNCLNRQPDQQS